MIIKLEKRYPLKLFISYVYIYNNNLSVIYFLKKDMIHTRKISHTHTHISQLKLICATKRNILLFCCTGNNTTKYTKKYIL